MTSARSPGRLLLERTNAPCHLPRFHASSSSGITGGRSLTPWDSTPADENRKGNVGSGRIASRRVVAWCCVALYRVVRSLANGESLSLSLSPIPGRHCSTNTIPFPSASLRLLRDIPVTLSRDTSLKRAPIVRPLSYASRRRKTFEGEGGNLLTLRGQARVTRVATGESPRQTEDGERSKKKSFGSHCLHILSFFTPSSSV